MNDKRRIIVAGFGECIYCSATDVKLSDEHIVPFALGGTHVIKKASCDRCAKETSAFERIVLRDVWGEFRKAVKAPSRRNKLERRDETLSCLTKRLRFIPSLPYYAMPRCGALLGLHKSFDLSCNWEISAVPGSKSRSSGDLEHRSWKGITSIGDFPAEFGKFLLKVAYCQVVAQTGTLNFERIAPEFILGIEKNLSYLVGQPVEPQKNSGHELGYRLRTVAEGRRNQGFIGARVWMFSNLGYPEYEVMVGRWSRPEELNELMRSSPHGIALRHMLFGT